MKKPIQNFILEVVNVIKIIAKKIIVNAKNMDWLAVRYANVKAVKMERLSWKEKK